MFLIIEHAAHDPAVRVVVWTATGRAFNAGADWKVHEPIKPARVTHPILADHDDWRTAKRSRCAHSKRHPGIIPQLLYPCASPAKHQNTSISYTSWQEAYRARGMGQPKSNDTACKNLTLAFWDFPKARHSCHNPSPLRLSLSPATAHHVMSLLPSALDPCHTLVVPGQHHKSILVHYIPPNIPVSLDPYELSPSSHPTVCAATEFTPAITLALNPSPRFAL